MFKGLKVYSLRNKTLVSFQPLTDIYIAFKEKNGLVYVDRICSFERDVNLFDIDLPVIELYEEPEFSWLSNVISPNHIDWIKRIEHKQILLTNSVNSSREIRELFDSFPTLVWLMVSELDNNWSHHTFSYYSLIKRREILSKIIGQECTGKHVKFLKKLDVLNGSEEEVAIIKQSLQSEAVVDSFKHREQINSLELYLVHTYPFLIGSGLLPELSSTKCNYFAAVKVGIAELLKTYQDTIELGNALDFKNSKMLVAACETTEQLESLHRKWIRQLNKSHTYLTNDINFEPFPAQSDSQFQFISSVNQLIQEGRVMKHCVATYREKALNKTSYIFRVTFPQRATMELGFKAGVYFLKQLKLVSNGEPSRETYKVATDWIEDINVSLGLKDRRKQS